MLDGVGRPTLGLVEQFADSGRREIEPGGAFPRRQAGLSEPDGIVGLGPKRLETSRAHAALCRGSRLAGKWALRLLAVVAPQQFAGEGDRDAESKRDLLDRQALPPQGHRRLLVEPAAKVLSHAARMAPGLSVVVPKNVPKSASGSFPAEEM